MSRRRSPERNRLEHLAVRFLGIVLNVPGLPGALALGRGLGRLVAFLDRRHVGICRENLRRAFPDAPAAWIDRTAALCYEHLGMALAEMLRLPRVFPWIWRDLVTIEGGESLAAIPPERPVIFVTGHIGNWEVSGWMTARFGRPAHAVARPLDNPLLDRIVVGIRERMGQRILDKHGALRSLARALREGKSIGLLLDQDARDHGIFVDVFGHPASTLPTAASLSMKYGAPIVHMCALREGRRPRYRLVVSPPLEPTPTGDLARDTRDQTQYTARLLESFVRRAPEQWLWMHRRWKTRPENDA